MAENRVDDLLDFGQMAIELGQWAQARDYFEQALKLDPSNEQAHSGLSHAKTKLLEQARTAETAVSQTVSWGIVGESRVQQIRCPNCGYEGPGKLWKAGGGQQVLELFLFLLFLIPWIIYKVFTHSKYQCPDCGNTQVVKILTGQTGML